MFDNYLEYIYKLVRSIAINNITYRDDVEQLVGRHGFNMLVDNGYLERNSLNDYWPSYRLCCEEE